MRAAYRLCTHYRQTDVIELSFLDHFIEETGLLLDRVVRVKSPRLEQVEFLRSTQGSDDGIDAPPQVLPAPVGY